MTAAENGIEIHTDRYACKTDYFVLIEESTVVVIFLRKHLLRLPVNLWWS